jgi:hypothetical protein
LIGKALGADEGDGSIEYINGRPMHSCVLRDLRLDVTYIFTLSARYPYIGRKEFEDALDSTPTSLRPPKNLMPVPIQLALPVERVRRIQQLGRCVLLKWSTAGLLPEDGNSDTKDKGRLYDLQALPEGEIKAEWMFCKGVTRLKVDGANAWLVKELPGNSLRYRFRLWDRASGRLGRTSHPMLSLVEPVTKLGVSRTLGEASAQLVLRAPLGSPLSSHDFVCRYQVRYRPEQVEAKWRELPIRMLWHRHNEKLDTDELPVDASGAVISGLESQDKRSNRANFASTTSENSGSGDPGDQNYSEVVPPLPTLPLPTVSAAGGVSSQRCIVEVLREEDGLVPTQVYSFSIRVGDTYHMSEWSVASDTIKLTPPAPQLSPTLSAAEAQITVSEVTGISLRAGWPQFLPDLKAGAPVHAEVEYLLTVTLVPMKRRLQGAARPRDEAVQPHGQWLLSSTATPGQALESFGRGNSPSVFVQGLTANSSYELKLQVRYARLGPRTWTDALSSIAHTGKMDAETRRAAAPESPMPQAPSEANARSAPGKTTVAPWAPIRLDAAAMISSDLGEDTPRRRMATENFERAVLEGSGRLPPLAVPAEGGPVTEGEDINEVMAEWKESTEKDTERLTSGAMAICWKTGMRVTPAAVSSDNVPARQPDFVPFWRRDPTDPRPMMPVMPSATSHQPAMELDLRSGGMAHGRPRDDIASEAGIAVRKPIGPPPQAASGRERAAYPRRILY